MPQVFSRWQETDRTKMFKQRSRKSGIFQKRCFWALRCRSVNTKMYSIRHRSVMLSEKGLYWKSILCIWKHSRTIQAPWHGALYSLKTAFPDQMTDTTYEFILSTVMFRESATFMFCSTTNTDPKDTHENVPRSIISTPQACAWPVV